MGIRLSFLIRIDCLKRGGPSKTVHDRESDSLRRNHFAVRDIHLFLIQAPKHIKKTMRHLPVILTGSYIIGMTFLKCSHMFRETEHTDALSLLLGFPVKGFQPPEHSLLPAFYQRHRSLWRVMLITHTR